MVSFEVPLLRCTVITFSPRVLQGKAGMRTDGQAWTWQTFDQNIICSTEMHPDPGLVDSRFL